jgi:predicted permease
VACRTAKPRRHLLAGLGRQRVARLYRGRALDKARNQLRSATAPLIGLADTASLAVKLNQVSHLKLPNPACSRKLLTPLRKRLGYQVPAFGVLFGTYFEFNKF